ncbi:MAG: helix-turn-helix transcriptional regulator, partial [Pseudomonadota bacterium]|nr:helix-turn-helix transcriptional regulator [Pseudomonadota bacterium]
MIGKEYQNKKVARNRAHGASKAVDVHIGRRVRKRRTLLGISQAELAEALGLTFQQV